MLGKVCAEYKLMENSAKNVKIYRVRSFRKVSEKFTDNFPNITNISRALSIASLPSSQKSCVLTLIESRINGPDRLYGNVQVLEPSQSDYSILHINMQSGNK